MQYMQSDLFQYIILAKVLHLKRSENKSEKISFWYSKFELLIILLLVAVSVAS